jgi:CHAT domain-containing protein
MRKVPDTPASWWSVRLFSFLWPLFFLLVVPLKDTRPRSAEAAYDHAWTLFERGYLALSQQESASNFERYQNSEPAWAAKFQLLEANSMLFRGMYDDTLRVLSSYGGSGPSDGTIEKLAIESVALSRLQHTSAADELLSQAEAICKTSAFETCGDEFAARAILDSRMGRMEDARKSFLHALSFARIHHNEWLQAGSFVNLGYVALQVDHFDEAVDWSRQAFQAAGIGGFENLAQVAEGNLGWAYFQLGDDERALEQFLAAGKAAARLGNVRNEREWLSTAGYVYRDSGDLDRATQSYQDALRLARQMNSKEDSVSALVDLADLSLVRGKLDDAENYIEQANSMESGGAIRPNPTLMLTMGKVAAARDRYPEAEGYFRSIQNDPASLMTTKLSAGFELAELAEAQSNTAAAEREYKAALATYETARAQLKSEESLLPFGENVAQIYDHYIHLLVQQGKSSEALTVAEQSRGQTLEQGLVEPGAAKHLRSAVLDPQEIAQKTKSTLLFYWLGERQSYLWAITSARTALFTLPAQREIGVQIQRYQKVLLDARDPLEIGDSDGQALYRELLAPAAALIHPGAPVTILADGILSQLNFETLLVPGVPTAKSGANSFAGMHYLIDDLTISSAPSLAMLAAAEPANRGRERILLLGNPVSPDQDFPSLPMFGFEMTRIESHFPMGMVSAYAGPNATPAAYLASDPGTYSYIHFVSHAVASQTNPLDSAIILSNSSGPEDSYKLYAREIIKHPIDARLVTISACYGSGTRAYAGEGLVGLSWAFLRAGAQRVIGALWEVSDDSTPRLMDTLYQGLTTGESPAVALRNAKLALLHSQTRFRVPYYWAPFQIYSRM